MPPIPAPVLVSGASSGIGRATVAELVRRGIPTIATVRREEDEADLQETFGDDLQILRFDLTDHDGVRERIGSIDRLGALVNNAGTALAGPLEFVDIDELAWQMDVNVFGHVVATQAALPLLRDFGEGARIITVGSIAGRVSGPMMGPYHMSKHAIAAFSDTLRGEVEGFGIGVSLVEPGVIDTEIWRTSTERAAELREGLPPEAEALYGEQIDHGMEVAARAARLGISAERVASTILGALEATSPSPRYLVGLDARVAGLMARLPSRVKHPIFKRVF